MLQTKVGLCQLSTKGACTLEETMSDFLRRTQIIILKQTEVATHSRLRKMCVRDLDLK
jgi:hypothetical protein